MKVLVTGANGQLGHEIVAQFEGLSTHEVVACDHLTVDVSSCTSDHLDQGGLASKEPLLVGIENRNEGDLGQIEALTKQVDAYQYIKGSFSQSVHDLYPVEGINIGMNIPTTNIEP